MSALALRALVLGELRLRARRGGTLVVMLALIAASWWLVADPVGGSTLIAVGGARVAYTSECVALGSALMAGLLLGLGGFYLVRGRMGEDVRGGTGAVLAATPVGNALFLLGRWLGSMAYLCLLVLLFTATMWVLHLLRGEGPLQPLVYLRTYALLLLPILCLVASMALLCEAWAPLMGKRGDVLYFLVWATQLGLIGGLASTMAKAKQTWSPLLLLDFSGTATAALQVQSLMRSPDFSMGAADYNPALATLLLPPLHWSGPQVLGRLACFLIAMLPLLPALVLFHRFAPDRVKSGGRRRRWSPLALANRWLRPLARLAAPLFALAARRPGLAGGALAELALTLALNPAAVAALLVLALAGALAAPALLGGLAFASVAVWGVLLSDLSVRDIGADSDKMTAAAPGGAAGRGAGQLLAAGLLGLLFTAPLALRWLLTEPLRAAALASGMFMLACAASLLGQATRGGRSFLALFLFALYASSQTPQVPALDLVGGNGVASLATVAAQVLLGLLLCGAGLARGRWRRARA
ncbi:hypothetical protein CSQ96_16095 [Janthinobacterium sp. BJB412]|nr:hypothetical protein CSQ96_16095 [Janthinobacterium sp. BJB412]